MTLFTSKNLNMMKALEGHFLKATSWNPQVENAYRYTRFEWEILKRLLSQPRFRNDMIFTSEKASHILAFFSR
jgi:hypothetical protein